MLRQFVRALLRPGGGQQGANGKPVPGASPAGGTCADLLQQAESLVRQGRLAAALASYRACALAYPQSLAARLGEASVLVDLWSIDEAIAAYGKARELAPAAGAVFSALLFHSHYRSPVDAHRLFDLHQQYGATMRQVVQYRDARCALTPEPGRRLRIGYVSPNFSRHSVGYFIEPVVRCHDRSRYEIFCYYAHHLSDDTTHRIRALADGWRDVADVDDDALDGMIRADRIDILVDLAGHSKGNHLGVFARRPAPVQLTWLGYPDTTGLATVGYRITDHTADPAPGAQRRHTEHLLRMDDCFLCYQPPPDSPPVAARGPASPIVFASFNSIAKLNEETIRTWGAILAAMEGSRLVLKSAALGFPDTVDRLVDSFEHCGIDPSRIELCGWIKDRHGHLELYQRIDIALDTFPYNGTTTTCEALWMGVPVVTLAGEVHMSRVGASILRCAGLESLVAQSAADYVAIAVALARDGGRRASLRAGLRDRLLASPLLDHAGFTRQFEQHCRQSWETWCAGSVTGNDPAG